MRWKVFHGRKSMICANSVLPRYMATPGWRHPERLCKPPFPIQVGDALCHSKSPAAIGFLTNTSQVNRTVLSEYIYSLGLDHAARLLDRRAIADRQSTSEQIRLRLWL